MTATAVAPEVTDPPDQFARRNLVLAVMCLALVMVVSLSLIHI